MNLVSFQGGRQPYKKIVDTVELTQNIVEFRMTTILCPLYTTCCPEVYHGPTQEAWDAVNTSFFSTGLEGERQAMVFSLRKHPKKLKRQGDFLKWKQAIPKTIKGQLERAKGTSAWKPTSQGGEIAQQGHAAQNITMSTEILCSLGTTSCACLRAQQQGFIDGIQGFMHNSCNCLLSTLQTYRISLHTKTTSASECKRAALSCCTLQEASKMTGDYPNMHR